MIIDEICDQLPPSAASCQAIEVRIGLGYTAVNWITAVAVLPLLFAKVLAEVAAPSKSLERWRDEVPQNWWDGGVFRASG